MARHEEFLELCAAATAGRSESGRAREARRASAECADCRRAMREYEVVTTNGVPSLASELARNEECVDDLWSVEDAGEGPLPETRSGNMDLPRNQYRLRVLS